METKQPELPMVHIITTGEYRAALSRVRMLEDAPDDTAAALERAALELAISRFLSHDEYVAERQSPRQ